MGKARGGRRHGLTEGGPSPRLLVTLTDADRGALERIAAVRGLSLAEAVRELIRDATRTS